MCDRRLTHVVVAASILAFAGAQAKAQKIYWAGRTSHTVQRANLDGTDVETIVFLGSDEPTTVAVDGPGGKIYWTAFVPLPGKIQRANLDGSNVETVVLFDFNAAPYGLALDWFAGKMYWTRYFGAVIQRANLDGTSVQDVWNVVGTGEGMGLDPLAGKLYFAVFDLAQGGIWQANLDGTHSGNIVDQDEQTAVAGITVDSIRSRLYWASAVHGLFRSNLDGSGVQAIIPDRVALGIALDSTAGKLYWSDEDLGYIRRSDLNGSNIENLINTGGDAEGLALCLARYGDVFPPGGNGVIDVDDINAGLAGFIDPASFPQADVEPCGGDGDIDVDDIQNVIAAFQGNYFCPHPCP